MNDIEILLSAPDDASELAAYLDERCGGDEVLRARVEALLKADRSAEGFMDQAAVDKELTAGSSLNAEGEGSTIGNYKLLQQIGEGGFGTVYMAEQLQPVMRGVAIKIIKLGMDTRQVVARFEAERQALAMMDHPNIAKVHDAGSTESGRPYFVMELVKGIPITEFCEKDHLGVPERLRLFMDVCRAVQHAHQKGIIHRDLKPSNVLVARHDDKAVPKVIDFGVAKATQQSLTDKTLFTRFEQFIGTPAYMSPEQAELSGLDIDTRSDIYSLGVLLYELVTGTTPFDARELARAGQEEVRRVIREEEPPRPSTRLSQLTAVVPSGERAIKVAANELKSDLDWIVMKALEKDRQRRYATANELVDDIQRHLDDEPVMAAAPSARYRIGKYVRRHRSGLSVAAVIALLLVAGSVVSTWMAVKLARTGADLEVQLDATERERQEARKNERSVAYRLAEDKAKADDPALGIARLARFLTEDASDRVSGERLMNALWQRDSVIPVVAPFPDAEQAWLSKDSRRILTTHSTTRVAQVWERNSGKGPWKRVGPKFECDTLLHNADISADGRRIVMVEGYGINEASRYSVYEVDTGRLLSREDHDRITHFAKFSPDGRKILIGRGDGVENSRVMIRDAEGGLLHRFQFGETVLSGDWSDNGRFVAVCCFDGTIGVFDAVTGDPVWETRAQHSGFLHSIRFSPGTNNLRVVSCSADGTVRVWNAESATPGESITMVSHGKLMNYAEFSPDGKLIVTASEDRTARVWDAATGEPITGPLVHKGNVVVARFSLDGQMVVTTSGDGAARLWDVRTGRMIGLPLTHQAGVKSAWFTQDGSQVLTAGRDGLAKLWDVRPGSPKGQILRHQSTGWRGGEIVLQARISPDGSEVMSSAEERLIRQWDTESGTLRHKAVLGFDWKGASYSEDGRWALLYSQRKGIQVWTREHTLHKSLVGPGASVEYAEFSSEETGCRWVAGTLLNDRTAQVWDVETGEALCDPPLKHKDLVIHVSFSRNGSRLLSCSADSVVKIWDWQQQPPRLVATLLGHTDYVTKASFSSDGKRVLTASPDGTARIWDAESGKELKMIPHVGAVKWAEWSRDGGKVVTCGDDNAARIWDAETWKQIGETMEHEGSVVKAGFSRNGQRVVTASTDWTARVWDAETGYPLSDPLRHNAPLTWVEFSSDEKGSRVVTAGKDLTARLWDLPPAPEGKVPKWVPRWAAAVVGLRLDGNTPVALGWEERNAIRQEVLALPVDNYYARIAKWFYDDPAMRPITPFSSMTLESYVANRLRENTGASIEEALRVMPSTELSKTMRRLLD
ncbi:protein kinase [Verrucomicrobiaceae bacterium 227]